MIPFLDRNIWNSNPVKTAAISLATILGRPIGLSEFGNSFLCSGLFCQVDIHPHRMLSSKSWPPEILSRQTFHSGDTRVSFMDLQ